MKSLPVRIDRYIFRSRKNVEENTTCRRMFVRVKSCMPEQGEGGRDRCGENQTRTPTTACTRWSNGLNYLRNRWLRNTQFGTHNAWSKAWLSATELSYAHLKHACEIPFIFHWLEFFSLSTKTWRRYISEEVVTFEFLWFRRYVQLVTKPSGLALGLAHC